MLIRGDADAFGLLFPIFSPLPFFSHEGCGVSSSISFDTRPRRQRTGNTGEASPNAAGGDGSQLHFSMVVVVPLVLVLVFLLGLVLDAEPHTEAEDPANPRLGNTGEVSPNAADGDGSQPHFSTVKVVLLILGLVLDAESSTEAEVSVNPRLAGLISCRLMYVVLKAILHVYLMRVGCNWYSLCCTLYCFIM
jgi:hypothetical protein